MAPAPERLRAERHGRKGEAAAAMFLRAKGWHILAERVRNPAGEIDLVAGAAAWSSSSR